MSIRDYSQKRMKKAFVPGEKTDLNPIHLNETSPTLEVDYVLSSKQREQTNKLEFLKNKILAKNKTVVLFILISGNIAVILLLLFIYWSL